MAPPSRSKQRRGYAFLCGPLQPLSPRQVEDVAKAKENQFEPLRNIYFYDAWRSQPELNQNDSLLHLPPSPGLLHKGCYWRPAPAALTSATGLPLDRLEASWQRSASQRQTPMLVAMLAKKHGPDRSLSNISE